jgi:pimeloyl-[acyl-carrier protein] synthase
MTLYSAGHRTTRDLFTNGLFTLLGDDKQRAAFLAAPQLDLTVQEFLRFAAPTLFIVRVAEESLELDSVATDPTTPVLVLLGAANRDPERYTDPDHFDIARDDGRPLSFAIGPHACLGQQLARTEAEIMLDAIATQLDLSRLQIAAPAPRWTQTGTFRGLDALRVCY